MHINLHQHIYDLLYVLKLDEFECTRVIEFFSLLTYVCMQCMLCRQSAFYAIDLIDDLDFEVTDYNKCYVD